MNTKRTALVNPNYHAEGEARTRNPWITNPVL